MESINTTTVFIEPTYALTHALVIDMPSRLRGHKSVVAQPRWLRGDRLALAPDSAPRNHPA